MSSSPLVSVIIPTRDRLRCLRRVLPSYLRQPEVGEIILVDDASPEPVTRKALGLEGAAERVRVLCQPQRGGAPQARNRAIAEATHEWVLYSDDDVFLADDYLAQLLATQQRTNADIVGGRRIYLLDGESATDALSRCNRLPEKPYDARYVEANFSVPLAHDRAVLHLQTTSLARRSVAREIGWDDSYQPTSYREETDFFLRAAARGYGVWFSADAVCYHLSPADTAVGGQRARSWWRYEIGVVRNNHRFLSRHFAFLHSQRAIEGGRWTAELRFVWWRLFGGFLRAQYSRYYRSPIRPVVQRFRGRRTGSELGG